MNKLMHNYAKKLVCISMLLSLSLFTACQLGNSQQIIIKFTIPVEIENNTIVSNDEFKNTKELERVNALSETHKSVFGFLFSDVKDSLNENKNLNTYITMTFIKKIDESTFNNIIKELEQLELVETAYQAPIGEDAGMSLPEK